MVFIRPSLRIISGRIVNYVQVICCSLKSWKVSKMHMFYNLILILILILSFFLCIAFKHQTYVVMFLHYCSFLFMISLLILLFILVQVLITIAYSLSSINSLYYFSQIF
jgi:hypothetical protein